MEKQYEVIEIKTGAKMSRSRGGEMMGTTLFADPNEAAKWMHANELSMSTHRVEVAK